MVNGNLKNCAHHKDTPLALGLHGRIGFASNWRLSCKMCDKDSVSVKNSIDYLKRTLDSCDDRVEFRAVKKRIYKKNERRVEFRNRKKRRQAFPEGFLWFKYSQANQAYREVGINFTKI